MIRNCRHCRYYHVYNRGEIYDHEDHHTCDYWKGELGAIVRTYGCEKFQQRDENDNLHVNNTARQDPKARNKGIHQEK